VHAGDRRSPPRSIAERELDVVVQRLIDHQRFPEVRSQEFSRRKRGLGGEGKVIFYKLCVVPADGEAKGGNGMSA
jgi:hypothetical protein